MTPSGQSVILPHLFGCGCTVTCSDPAHLFDLPPPVCVCGRCVRDRGVCHLVWYEVSC